MKTKLLAGAAMVAALAAAGAASAQDGWYGAIDVGAHKTPGVALIPANPAIESFRVKTRANVAAFARV
ncbi:MAG: hypothetical protein JOZ27_04550, partial [Caulobacteraceae bacterium]|nr:hypothetical protein [Caulobacteraceae bacterium]